MVRGGGFRSIAGVWFAVRADVLRKGEMFSLDDGFDDCL